MGAEQCIVSSSLFQSIFCNQLYLAFTHYIYQLNQFSPTAMTFIIRHENHAASFDLWVGVALFYWVIVQNLAIDWCQFFIS